MNVKAKIDGFVNQGGVPILLAVGDEYEESHPLVAARPELFTAPEAPPAPAKPAPEAAKPAAKPASRGRTKSAEGDSDG